MLACANAAGSVIPPMVIFEGQKFNPEWSNDEVPDTLYGMSEKGWTDQEMFFFWMTELFVKHIPPARPVLLLVDGHSSHYEPDTIRAAAEQGVIVFCLPPHCTHIAQPLDVSFFRPLKVYWSEACHTFMQENPGSVITKYQFSTLFSKAWYKAIQPQNLIAGFKKCGIYPYNPEAIKAPITTPDEGDDGGIELEREKKLDETSIGGNDDMNMDDGDERVSDTFSPEQIVLFTLRYENGYSLFIDSDYVSWLLKNHPDDVPTDLLSGVSDPSQPFGNESLATEQEAMENGIDLPYTSKDIPECTPESSEDEHSHDITEKSCQQTKDSPSQSTTSKQTASNSSSCATSSSASYSTSPTPAHVQTASTQSVSHTPVTPKSSSISPTLAQTTSTPSVSHTPVTPKSSSISPTLAQTTLTPSVSRTPVTPKSSSISPTLAQTTSTPSVSRTPVTPKSSSISPTLAQTASTPSVSHTPVTPKSSSISPTLAQATLTPSSSNRKPLSSLTGLLNFPTPPLTLTTKKKIKKKRQMVLVF